MTSNFHLFQIPNRDSLHVYMRGDFDAASAFELINALKNQNKEYLTVFIDTNDLNQIHAFGIDVFQKKLSLAVQNSKNLIFMGRHKHRFAV